MSKKKQSRITYGVTIDLPQGVTGREMQDYIREAVQSWKGSKLPDDTNLVNLNHETVRVALLKRVDTYA